MNGLGFWMHKIVLWYGLLQYIGPDLMESLLIENKIVL
jgi:hypothetical protein